MQIPVYRYIKTKEGWEKTISFIPKNSLSSKNSTILLVSYQTIFHMYYVYKLPKNKTKELYKKMNTEEPNKKYLDREPENDKSAESIRSG